MPYDSTFNNALAGFHRPAAIVSALIFSAVFSVSVSAAIEKNNYFYNAPTKTWIPTSSAVITPQGTVINNSAANQAQTFLNNGGFSNKSTITAKFPTVKKTVSVTVNARVSSTAVKAAAKNVLKGGVATIAIGAGINALLNGLGWVMGEGGTVTRSSVTTPSDQSGSYCHYMPRSSFPIYAPNGAVHTIQDNYGGSSAYCPAGQISVNNCVERTLGYAPSPQAYWPKECRTEPNQPMPPAAPVSFDDIDQAVDSNYSPTVDDYPALAPYLPPSSTLIDPIPQVNEPASTVTVTDLDTGKTTTTDINIWHNFDISDNPSTSPKVDVKTTQDTKTYTDGQLTGTSTTSTTSPADDNQPSAGGAPRPEPPIDCDLFPTACAWMEWTQEPPEEPDDDLSKLLKEVPVVNETFTITGGAAACPAPLVLNLSQFGSREVSYQPLCDLASTMKYLYLALMSLAAAVLLHRSISRV